MDATEPPLNPPPDCDRCPRLADYRAANRRAHPDWFNAPVPARGDASAWLAVVGLAPGLAGANRTGLPFSGDASGALLDATLAATGLQSAFITNAVRCAPPGNKPTSLEIHTCRPFLTAQLAALPKLKVVVALGQIAHQSAVKACGGKLPKTPFAHGAVHRLHTGITIIDSYHPSALNTNTGRLTAATFADVFAAAVAEVQQ